MAKRRILPLVSGRVRLRLLEEADLPMTLAWRNQDHIRKWFFSSDVISADRHRAWWEQYKDRDDDFVFIVEETEMLRRPVGQASLYQVDWTAGRGKFGRLMIGDPQAEGLGLAKLATARLAEEALTRWGLGEVYLECHAMNSRALAVYEACGFERSSGAANVVAMSKHCRQEERGDERHPIDAHD